MYLAVTAEQAAMEAMVLTEIAAQIGTYIRLTAAMVVMAETVAMAVTEDILI